MRRRAGPRSATTWIFSAPSFRSVRLASRRCSGPLVARAQQAKVPTIGALVIGNINPEQFWREFRQGLHDLGYVEGQNIRFEFRSAEGEIRAASRTGR